MGLTYAFPATTDLGDAADWNTAAMDTDDVMYAVQVLSDDGMGITWAIPSSDLTLATSGAAGGNGCYQRHHDRCLCGGNGEDITVTVMVAGLAAEGSPVKLADVTTGLDIEVTGATGCSVTQAR